MKHLFLAVFLLSGILFAQAQETEKKESEIKMKNGEVIKAVITEAVPDKYIKIESGDSTRTINIADIEKISTPKPGEKPKSKIQYCLLASADVNYSRAKFDDYEDHFSSPGFGASIINGFKKGPVALGLGTGIFIQKATLGDETSILSEEKSQNFILPVFLNFRVAPFQKKISPSFELALGVPIFIKSGVTQITDGTDDFDDWYSIYHYEDEWKYKGKFFIGISPGVNFKLGESSWLYVDFLYRITLISAAYSGFSDVTYYFPGENPYQYTDTVEEKISGVLHQIGVKVGIMFSAAKQ